MDPLTHTLVGASLAATPLRAKTRLAAPALIIGANLPDVDVLAYVRGADFALGFRRGWTHGILALIVLPVLLALGLWLWDRRRDRNGMNPPLNQRWLFGLSYLAVATHPTLDWLNTYGMRWWMPFRDTWYYGDSVFIVDPWLWLTLGSGWLLGRRARAKVVVPSAVIAAFLLSLVISRAPAYAPLVIVVVLVLLITLVRTPRSPYLTGHRTAAVGLALATLFILAMIVLQAVTENRARHELRLAGVAPIQQLMIGPRPANPLSWDVVALQDDVIRFGEFRWRGKGELVMNDRELTSARLSPTWAEMQASGQSTGFLRWVRFPWLEIESGREQGRVYVMDARYTRRRRAGFGAAVFELPTKAGD